MCAGSKLEKDGISDYSRYLIDGISHNDINVRVVPLGYYEGDRHFYKDAAEKASAADICHVQFNYPYFNGELPHKNRFLYFAKHVKVPLVMTVHEARIGLGPLNKGFSSNMSRLAYNTLLPILDRWSISFHKKMYKVAGRIIVHTAEHQKAIGELMQEPGKVVLIPHGIPSVAEPDRKLSGAPAKRALGLQDKTVLTIFGFINGRKGYECALESISRLPGNVALLIAGGRMTESATDRAYYDAIIGIIARKKMTDRVKITGYLGRKDIPSVMAATDICLAPFSSTAASGALSLSIGYHKPIIASDIRVHKEINARVACLELFPEGDPASLSDKIRALTDERERMLKLSDASAAYAQRYSYANAAKETLRLYESVLAESPA